MAEINRTTLRHLADLGKLEVKKGTEEKLIHDLGEILSHFEELKEIDTENIEPLAGGTIETNVFREDEPGSKNQAIKDKLVEAFPEGEAGFLKVPAVFEE